jgi:hypothetical protein
MYNFFETTHPKNGYDIVVHYDETGKLVSAEYGDGECVEVTSSIKATLQADIDAFTVDI